MKDRDVAQQIGPTLLEPAKVIIIPEDVFIAGEKCAIAGTTCIVKKTTKRDVVFESIGQSSGLKVGAIVNVLGTTFRVRKSIGKRLVLRPALT